MGYGDNTPAGDKSGTIVISTRYNKTADSYEYGGTVNLNFKIVPAEAVTL